MPMSNLIEYSSNYSETTGNLWFSLKDEATDFNAGAVNSNYFKFLSINVNYWETQLLMMKLME